jgi:hypothetical protein
MESMWVGQTGKNISQVFKEARRQNAVLFFDEADAIASRRLGDIYTSTDRYANQAVNILLSELEEYDGVVIFATNLAANFDPAFERRIHSHILFRLPAAAERAAIWRGQLHSRLTPLADDVDFEALGRDFMLSGGDIKNAVLKAAQLAACEPVPDEAKRIHQRHFVEGAREVLAARAVMGQSLFDAPLPGWLGAASGAAPQELPPPGVEDPGSAAEEAEPSKPPAHFNGRSGRRARGPKASAERANTRPPRLAPPAVARTSRRPYRAGRRKSTVAARPTTWLRRIFGGTHAA